MTQVSAQRGTQPLHYANQATLRKAERPHQSTAPARSTGDGVKFGGFTDKVVNAGLSGIEKVVPVSLFEKITEVFLVGFLAQDIIAMWLPRVGTSLRVGREPYDPKQDPQAQNLPPHQQFQKWLVNNYKGLNWVNFYEETKREVATGPGLLAVPAVTFILNRYMGNRAREMSYNSLKGLGSGFSEHLKDLTALDQPVNKKAYKKAVQQYINDLFADPKLTGAEKDFLREWSKDWTNALFEQENKHPGKRWLESTKRFFSKSAPTRLEELSSELSDKVRGFNRSTEARMLAYKENFGTIADDAPLHHGEQTWITYNSKSYKNALKGLEAGKQSVEEAKHLIHHQNVDHLTADLNRFGGYVKAVYDNFEKGQKKTAISEVAEHTMKSLASSKLMLGVGTTVLTGLYLLKLAFWAQNHKSYQAVRLLKHDATKGNQIQQGQHQHLMNDHRQVGLPFGAQPTSLYTGMSQTAFRVPSAPMMNGLMPRPINAGPTQFHATSPQPGWRQA